jgi:hypothetical protein
VVADVSESNNGFILTTAILCHVRNASPSDTSSHAGRPNSSATPLWALQISHTIASVCDRQNRNSDVCLWSLESLGCRYRAVQMSQCQGHAVVPTDTATDWLRRPLQLRRKETWALTQSYAVLRALTVNTAYWGRVCLASGPSDVWWSGGSVTHIWSRSSSSRWTVIFRAGCLTHQTSVVTVCTTMFNIHKFDVLPTQCIYVFCVDLRTNSDYFTVQH